MMMVVIKPVFDTAKCSVERARDELVRALGFMGNVISAEANGPSVIVRFEINPQWHLPTQKKLNYLKESIPAKVRSTYRVISVSEDNHS
jgi:hypothetical protein